MYNDYILLLNNGYRKFREKEKDASLFYHFLAVIALKCIYDTRDRFLPVKENPELVNALGRLFGSPDSVTDPSQLDEVIKRLNRSLPTLLDGIFEKINFRELATQYSSTANRLPGLLEDLAEFSFTENAQDYPQSAGAATEYLIEKFVEEQFHKQGFLYTPRSISSLMVALAEANPHMTIYDPAAGLGTILVQCAKTVRVPEKQLFGQEINPHYWQLAKLNLLFNGLVKAQVEPGNSLHKSRFGSGSQQMTFDRVICHPPFLIDELLPDDTDALFSDESGKQPSFPLWEEPSVLYRKNGKHAEPKSGNYLSHILSSLNPAGKAIMVVPHGVLFKLGTAQAVRKYLVEKNLIEAVIDLPPNIFYSSKVNVALLVLNKQKIHADIVFIDASESFEPDRRRNKLRREHRQRIIQAYQSFTTEKDYSYVARPAEIAGPENEYNLTVKRYVKQKENQTLADLDSLRSSIDQLTHELKTIQRDLEYELSYFSNRRL